MPNYQFDDFLSVTIRSSRNPLDGQDHRSSKNFPMTCLKSGSHMRWLCPEGVSFDIMKDVTGKDKVLATNVHDGSITDFFATDDLYIANPQVSNSNVGSDFLIQVDSIGYSGQQRWMDEIYGNLTSTKISQINIPGTHDSGSIQTFESFGTPYSCQRSDITAQLNGGVRLLDIRLKVKKSGDNYTFAICHGDKGFYLSLNEFQPFEDVYKECTDFLRKNPSEFLIMTIKVDDWKACDNEMEKNLALTALAKFFENNKNGVKTFQFNDYTYGQVKGGIVFINRITEIQNDILKKVLGPSWKWENNKTFTVSNIIKGTTIYVQDKYKVDSTSTKVQYIKELLKKGDTSLRINFCSGYIPGFMEYPFQIDTLRDVLNYLGQTLITSKGDICKIGWLLFDYAFNEAEMDNGYSLNAVNAVIDSNREEHHYYNYHAKE